MRVIQYVLLTVSVVLLFLLFSCKEQPEYMNPYGEGVDPDTVVTEPFKSRTTGETTKRTYATSPTIVPTTGPTKALVVPEGYRVCPDCNGALVVCELCNGTDRCKAEIYDEEAAVVIRKYVECEACSDENPGYLLCETCHNELVIKE